MNANQRINPTPTGDNPLPHPAVLKNSHQSLAFEMYQNHHIKQVTHAFAHTCLETGPHTRTHSPSIKEYTSREFVPQRRFFSTGDLDAAILLEAHLCGQPNASSRLFLLMKHGTIKKSSADFSTADELVRPKECFSNNPDPQTRCRLWKDETHPRCNCRFHLFLMDLSRAGMTQGRRKKSSMFWGF